MRNLAKLFFNTNQNRAFDWFFRRNSIACWFPNRCRVISIGRSGSPFKISEFHRCTRWLYNVWI